MRFAKTKGKRRLKIQRVYHHFDTPSEFIVKQDHFLFKL